MSEQPEAMAIPLRKRSPEEVRERLRSSDLPPELAELLIEELGDDPMRLPS
jgi:hypothetical protein